MIAGFMGTATAYAHSTACGMQNVNMAPTPFVQPTPYMCYDEYEVCCAPMCLSMF